MKKIFFLTLAFILGLNLQNLNAQCGTGCTTTLNNYTSSSNYTFTTGLTCFTGTSTINNDVVFSSGSSICVGTGATVSFGGNNYTFSSPTTTVNIDVFGTMNVNQNPTWTGNVNIIVHSGGTLNIGSAPNFGTITLKGAKMDITNDGTFNVGTIQFQQTGATITITNNSVMTVKGQFNISEGNALFKNTGTLSVSNNYSSNATSVYINCGTYTGQFNLNKGGKLINTGTFNTPQIDYGGPTSRVENYGRFNVSGNINLGGSGSVFYNEGITTFTAGQFSSDGDLVGPSDSNKRGYFVWPNKATMNSGKIGPNLNFRKPGLAGPPTTSVADYKAAMFNAPGSMTFNETGNGNTWGNADPATLPATDCPQPDGTPAVPVPALTSVCSGVNLTTLQPSYSNVTYEWWNGTSTTTRTTQITGSSLTNYTTAGTVYLWARNVSSAVYSASGAAVTVNADPVVTISPSSSSVCTGTNVTLTASVSGGTGAVASYQWMSSATSGGTYTNISGATASTYSPPTSTIGTVYYKVSITQTGGGCDGTSASVSVEAKNCPPVANNDTGNVNENAILTVAAAGVLSNDTDPNAGILTVTAIRTGTEAAGAGTSGTVGSALSGTYGTLTLSSNGSYTYNANLAAVEALAAGATAVDYFTYTISNGKGGTDQAQLTITITGVNDAPVVAAIPKTGTEDTDITFTASDFTSKFTDVDGNALLKIKVVDLPANGTLKLNDVAITAGQEILAADLAKITFTPAANWNGSTSFNWNGSDGTTYAVTNAPVNITVTAVNDAPVVAAIPKTGTEDTDIAFMASDFTTKFTDVDGNTLSKIKVVDLPANGTLKLNGVAITAGQEILAADLAKITFTPAANWNGSTSFNWNGSDGTTYAVSNAPVNITVTAVNDAPVVAAIPKTGTEDTDIAFTATDFTSKFTDVDGNALSKIKVVDLPANGTLKLNGVAITAGQEILAADLAKITFTPAANWNGSTSFNWNGSDGTTYAVSNAPVNITVTAMNDAPLAINDVNVTGINKAVSGQVLTNDKDPEGDPLIVTAETKSTTHGAVIINANGTYTYTPAAGFTGEDTFTYTVCDNHGACSQASVTINVMPLPTTGNDAPVAINDAYQGTMNKTVTGNVKANDLDVDGDVLTVIADGLGMYDSNGDGTPDARLPIGTEQTVWGKNTTGTAVEAGKLTLNSTGTFTFVPSTGFAGQVSFTYVIYDGAGGKDSAAVTIDVTGGNSTFATDDAFIGFSNGMITGSLMSNDYDPQGDQQTITTTPVAAPAHGVLTINANGTFTYTPNPEYSGTDQFVYQVCDNGTPSVCTQATVYLFVASTTKSCLVSNKMVTPKIKR